MKPVKKINNLIRSGVTCELAERVIEKGLSLSRVKQTSKTELLKHFTEEEVVVLLDLKRKPIPQETIDRLFDESAARCCLCWRWEEPPPLIIHHIVEHTKTQDDNYENLVLLCLNHHAEVHTVSKLSRHNKPPNYIVTQKTKWIRAVTEYQAGRRPAPGSEKTKRIHQPTAPPSYIQFVGREKNLRQITQYLLHGQESVLAITGMGGVGKTALAQKIVEHDQVKNEYSGGIFWASLSEVNGEVISIFLTWAIICGNEILENQDTLNAAEFVYLMRNILTTYVSEHGRILIVIDDVREEWLSNAILIQKAIPQNCSILLTTRSREMAKSFGARLINLREMLPKNALKMLSTFVEGSLIDENELLAQKLLKVLGYLPLAIELAGKRISLEQDKPGFSLDGFLEAVRSHSSEKLRIKGHPGLTATFSITYDSLLPQSQAAFRQISIFASNLFPVEQAVAITGLDSETIVFILDDMVMQSLLQWGVAEGEYTVHPLLKQFGFQLLQSDNEADIIQNRYINFFLNSASSNAEETFEAHQVLDRIWPDIRKAFSFAVTQKKHKTINHLASILWRDSRFLYVRGYIKEAVYILTEAIQVCRQYDWKRDEVGHLIHIGTAYNHLGKTDESLQSYQAALTLNQQLQDPQTNGICLNNLGLIYYNIGQLAQAEYCFSQALHIAEELQDTRLAVDVLGSLGGVQRSLGALESARSHYSGHLKLSKMLKDKMGEGNALSNIGLTYYDEQDFEKAQKYIDQGLQIAQEIGDRRGEANRLGHLGNIYNLTGSPNKAIEYFSKAIDICRAISHRMNEGNWVGNMGNSYRALGKPDKAIDLFKQALNISQEVQSSKQELIWLLNLGMTYHEINKWDQAVECLEGAAYISEELRDYDKYKTAMNALANIYNNQGKTKELHTCYRKQLQVSQAIGDLKTTAILLNQIGVLLLYLGKLDDAAANLQQGLAVSRQLQDKVLQGDSLNNLALHARNISRFNEAIELYQQARSCYQDAGSKIGEGITIGELGITFLNVGQIDKAIDSLSEAFSIFQSTKYVLKFAFALGNLGNAYSVKGETEKAVEYHEQALAISQSLHDNMNAANWLGALGHDYVHLEQYEKAKDLYTQCLSTSRQIGVPYLEANSFQGLGVVYRALSQLQLSDRNFQKALILSEKLQDKSLQAGCLLHIGTNLLRKGKVKKAQKKFRQSLQIAQQINSRIHEATALWELGLLYEIDVPETAFSYMSEALLIFEECGIAKGEEYIGKLEEVKVRMTS